MYFHNDSLDTVKAHMLRARIYLGEHPVVGGAPVGKSNSLVAGEGYHRPVFLPASLPRCLLPFSDFAAVRFPDRGNRCQFALGAPRDFN